jgi:type 1 glutamine amidotransferase
MMFSLRVRLTQIVVCSSLLFFCCKTAVPVKTLKVLVYTKTAGFYHSSIPAGIKAIKKIGADNGYGVDVSTNASIFTAEKLSGYKTVIFLNTTGDVLDTGQQKAFENYINNGGGFVGVHAASDTEHDWPWYTALVGARFAGHPNNPNVFVATIQIKDSLFVATKGLPASWERVDEWYNFTDISKEITVVANLDETSYTGGTNGIWHPISWYQDYSGGRSFYTGLGHTEDSYSEPLFLQHLAGGIRYAMGL